MTDVTGMVRERYGKAALEVVQGNKAGCCGTGSSCGSADPITRDLYDTLETEGLPAEALLASLGCGNPTALAELRPARRCWISARAAESTCFSRRSGLDRLAWPMGST